MTKLKACIYVRTSKLSQDYERQISDLKGYCEKKDFEIVSIISEKVSGL